MSEITFQDFKFCDFVQNLYKMEPNPPFSLSLEFLSEIDKEELQKLLAYFVIEGAKIRFNKTLNELSKQDIDYLREYLLSIGYEATFDIKQEEMLIKGKNQLVNRYYIDFFPARAELRKGELRKGELRSP